MYDGLPNTIASSKLINKELLKEKIYEGPIHLQTTDHIITLEGIITYSQKPRPKILFKGRIVVDGKLDFSKLNSWQATTDNGLNGSVLITSFEFNSKGEKQIGGEFTYEICQQDFQPKEKICFSVLNFVNNRGQMVRYGDRVYAGRISIQHNGYKIIIDKIPDSKKVFDQLKRNGRFSITHVGQIYRNDNNDIDFKEVEELLDKIMWTLSFAAGHQVGIGHIFNKTAEGIHITHYRLPLIAEWKQHSTWFPSNTLGSLESVIEGFLNLMEDNFWNSQIPILLSGYFDSFGPSYIENKIIVLQATLETLSWSYLVEETKKVTPGKFKASRASTKIRRILNEFNIEATLTGNPTLEKLIDQYEDGPHLFTKVRNDIAHPKKKLVSLDTDTLYYIWRMGVRYFELIMLGLAQYKGVYRDSLLAPNFEGKMIREVPWVQPKS
ncbi:hypothetical protein AB1K83_05695 [Sporosarcina sp. 179-K 3D1 HS]|uniref:hypothetical protein n=1 Tax=Sporosarcina sp. 179-K 3D1 HS TaxID=3232169 RepID=UPI00399F0BCC